MTLCNLGVGATFGESILHDLPRDSTVVTKTTCELLRVEQADFRLIFEVSLSVSVSGGAQTERRAQVLSGKVVGALIRFIALIRASDFAGFETQTKLPGRGYCCEWEKFGQSDRPIGKRCHGHKGRKRCTDGTKCQFIWQMERQLIKLKVYPVSMKDEWSVFWVKTKLK